MIERALRLQEPLTQWIALNSAEQPSRRLPTSDRLTDDDWNTLKETLRLLEPLREETLRFESRDPGGIGVVLGSLFYLISFFTAERDRQESLHALQSNEATEPRRTQRQVIPNSRYNNCEVDWPAISSQATFLYPSRASSDELESQAPHSVTFNACEAAIDKLESYKEQLDHSPVYWAAAILHPAVTMKWVTDTVPHRADSIQQRFETFFKEGWCEEIVVAPTPPITDLTRPSHSPLRDLFPRSLYEEPALGGGSAVRELRSWLSHPAERIKCPIQWWLQHQALYPLLSKMALDILIIPPMSAECERVFSRAKLSYGSQRHSLNKETLGALECLKSWKAGC